MIPLRGRFRGWWLAIAVCLYIGVVPATAVEGWAGDGYQVGARIEVAGLSSNSRSVPVSCGIDFRALLESAKLAGVVDEQSIQLFHAENGQRVLVPVQFDASLQPRTAKRQLVPGTSTNVSFVAEFEVRAAPRELNPSGELTWLAKSGPDGTGEYFLCFTVRTNGTVIQVPYEPNNFRAFAPGGKAWPAGEFPALQIKPQWPTEGFFEIHDGGQLFCRYNIGPTVEQVSAARAVFRRPFIYPVIGPDGVPLTGFGKPHDPTGSHRHHYSLWVAHNRVNEADFWSEKGGCITSEGFDRIEQGPVFAEIIHRTSWRTGATEVVRERRTTRFYARDDGPRLIDVGLEFTVAGDQPVTFGKTSFGFLATRVAATMSPFDGGGEITNSEGDLNEQRAHLRHATWLDQSGPITPGKWGGIAILEHPSNPRSPTGWHCRNDGWAGASFNLEGPYELAADKTLVLQYRVVLHSGNAAEAEISRRYAEFVAQPRVRVFGLNSLDQ